MKKFKQMLMVAGCIAAMSLGANSVMAQRGGGGGNFDPAQMRQRMMDRYKETLEVSDDAEWKVLETAIGKVMDAEQEVRAGRAGGFGGAGARGGRGGRGGAAGGADTAAGGAGGAGGGRGGRGGMGGTPSPEAEELQKAIDAKAPADEIKTKLAALRNATKAKETKLMGAQDDLRKLLTARQEAVAVLGGLLK